MRGFHFLSNLVFGKICQGKSTGFSLAEEDKKKFLPDFCRKNEKVDILSCQKNFLGNHKNRPYLGSLSPNEWETSQVSEEEFEAKILSGQILFLPPARKSKWAWPGKGRDSNDQVRMKTELRESG
jgi:hypothetical protein